MFSHHGISTIGVAKRHCNELDVNGRESSKRQKVKASTYQKWVRDYDHEYKTVSSLDSVTSWHNGEKVVEKLKCKVCTKYKERIIRETLVISGLKVQIVYVIQTWLGIDDTMYMPIVQSLSSISEQERQKLRIKFNIAYFIATEQLAYQKYPKLCELQTKLGMNLGSSYLNENAAREFIHFMAKLKLQSIISSVQSATFFSLLMDGSTDSSNSENEMILVMWRNVESDDCKIHTKMAYLPMHTPLHSNAEVLFEISKAWAAAVGYIIYNTRNL